MTAPASVPLLPRAYIGEITAEFRAAAPEFQELVRQAGQPVTVKRPNGQAMTTIAFFWQEEPGGENSVESPVFKVLGWNAFFIPEPDIYDMLKMPDWFAVDTLGRIFKPDCETADIGEQGILLWAHFHPLPSRTRLSVIAFHAATGATTIDPETGNTVPVYEPEEIPVRLHATTDPKLRDTAGAEVAETVLIGRWGTLEEPQPNPLNVDWGDTAPFELDGQPGQITIKVAYPDADLATEAAFGARFLATWRAT